MTDITPIAVLNPSVLEATPPPYALDPWNKYAATSTAAKIELGCGLAS